MSFALLVGLLKLLTCTEKRVVVKKNQLRKKLLGSTYAFEVVISNLPLAIRRHPEKQNSYENYMKCVSRVRVMDTHCDYIWVEI